ncbi:MAG TPA: NUDIX domain-containing protein [Longimicrobium sp.]|nr:NUDIX domain-containing protein [Longimicrobium sp.]
MSDDREGEGRGGVPEWALRYDAGEYPLYAVTGDAVALARDAHAGGATLRALVVVRGHEPFAGHDAWPGGFLDWERDPTTREAALRELMEETAVAGPEYLEPLGSYTQNGRDPRQFAGHPDPESGEWVPTGARVASNAYLMLMPAPADVTPDAVETGGAHWSDVYRYLPWEDLRGDAGRNAAREVLAEVERWAAREGGGQVRERIAAAFGQGFSEWNEERVAERWRLLFDARLVPEARRDRWGRSDGKGFGREMAFDHRRILADALARVRGKIKYVPNALRALAGDEFTLDELQAACEAVAGRRLHRANFRRAVAQTRGDRQTRAPRIVAGTGKRRPRTGEPGVAPEVFAFLPGILRARLDPSLRLPFLAVDGSAGDAGDGSEAAEDA